MCISQDCETATGCKLESEKNVEQHNGHNQSAGNGRSCQVAMTARGCPERRVCMYVHDASEGICWSNRENLYEELSFCIYML